MHCNVCASDNTSLLGQLNPYDEFEWSFDIHECHHCGTRFTHRDGNINYHEILHSHTKSPYAFHYDKARYIKKLLESGELKKCENYLRQNSYTYDEIIGYIRTHATGQSKILEIGSSTGFLTAFLRSSGFNAWGIDISETAIAFATKHFGEYFSVTPLENKYDIIIHSGLIGCVDSPAEFLSFYLELLDEKGIMIFNAPNVNSPKMLKEIWVTTPPPDLIYLFSEKSFDYLIKRPFTYTLKKRWNLANLLRKNLSLVKHIPYASYPRKFQADAAHKGKSMPGPARTLFKNIILRMVYFLSLIGLVKKIDDEYGLIIHVQRTK